MRRISAAICVLACLPLLLAACGTKAPDHAAPPAGADLTGDFGGVAPGSLLSAETMPDLDPQLRAETSVAARITYLSTSGVDRSRQKVSGTVFVPKGDPPPGGWKIVAYGHPATGIHAECAPSNSPTLLGSEPTVAALVEAGFMVTMADYQGLGLDGVYHPFLDSTTEGYNLIDSVLAARKLVPSASGQWAAYGVGQGGQAAWAANELTPDYRAGLNFVGAAAVAPLAALDGLADTAANGTLTSDQQLTLVQFLAAQKAEYGDFDLDAYRHGVAKENWDVLSACWGSTPEDRLRIAAQMGPDDLRPDGEDATQVLRGYLQKTSLPQAPAAVPMVIVPAAPDGPIPQAQTDAAIVRACAMGDVLATGAPEGDGDGTAVLGWITDRFNGVPAKNDCAEPTATDAG